MSRLYLFIVKCFYGAKIHKISAISKFIADILQIELRGWMGGAGRGAGSAATAGGAAAICPAFAYTSSETIILSFVGDHVGDVSETKLTERQRIIPILIKASPSITAKQMSETLSVSQRTIERDLSAMQKIGVLKREGKDNDGLWIVLYQI